MLSVLFLDQVSPSEKIVYKSQRGERCRSARRGKVAAAMVTAVVSRNAR